MSRRLLIAAGGGSSFAPTPAAITVEFAWVGAVTTTTATVKARITDSSSPVLAITGAPAVSGVEGADDIFTFDVEGLTANTAYAFGFVGSSVAGTITTNPTGSFVVAAASCAGNPGAEYITGAPNTSDSPAFDRIRDRDPALFIHLGDIHYRDIATASAALYRTAYRDVLANDRQHDLYRNVPLAYVWDDHDYGANDSDGTSVSKAQAQQVYREYVPHYPLPADSRVGGDGEIYQSFAIGRVRFILLDCRSERTPNGATDNSSKTMLGTDQKNWLKAELLAVTEPVIVLGVISAWNSSIADNWGSFGTEKAELVAYFAANSLTDRLFLLHGDIHAVMADDGTNTSGLALAGFAPLDGGATTLSGTYTEPATLDTNQQYGTLAFDDQGSQIVVTAKAWAVTGASEAEVFSMDVTYPA